MSERVPNDLAAGSNSLADLAARINAFHKAAADGLRRSVENAINAGALLIEAKERLQHGAWLPWLRDHCAISERAAQLYMRCAKNREAIEANAKSATLADLTLNETAAFLMLSSDVRKLFNFVKEAEHLSGEALVELCIAEGVGLIQDTGYDPFADSTEAEKLEWHLYVLFQCFDREAGRGGGEPERVNDHAEYLLQKQFHGVADWIGEKGDNWRGQCRMTPMPEKFKAAWALFLEQHRDWALPQVTEKLTTLQRRFVGALDAGELQSDDAPKLRVRRRRLERLRP